MLDVLSVGFSCNTCKTLIPPARIFGDGGLDRDRELLACIGQEVVDFYDFCKKQYEAADVMGFERNNPLIQLPLAARSYLIINLVNLYKGENYA